MNLIERLEHGETYTDAVDDAIYEILRLRGAVESYKKERDTLRRALEKACELINEDGECPNYYGWVSKEIDCTLCAVDTRKACWLQYFMEEDENVDTNTK